VVPFASYTRSTLKCSVAGLTTSFGRLVVPGFKSGEPLSLHTATRQSAQASLDSQRDEHDRSSFGGVAPGMEHHGRGSGSYYLAQEWPAAGPHVAALPKNVPSLHQQQQRQPGMMMMTGRRRPGSLALPDHDDGNPASVLEQQHLTATLAAAGLSSEFYGAEGLVGSHLPLPGSQQTQAVPQLVVTLSQQRRKVKTRRTSPPNLNCAVGAGLETAAIPSAAVFHPSQSGFGCRHAESAPYAVAAQGGSSAIVNGGDGHGVGHGAGPQAPVGTGGGSGSPETPTSLGGLTRKFLDVVRAAPGGVLDLNQAATLLKACGDRV
jgi:hypothetical protein